MRKIIFVILLFVMSGLVGCSKLSYEKYYDFKDVVTYNELSNDEATEILRTALIKTMDLYSYSFNTTYKESNDGVKVRYYTYEVKRNDNEEVLKVFKDYDKDNLIEETTEYVDDLYSYVKSNHLGEVNTFKEVVEKVDYIEQITGIRKYVNNNFDVRKAGKDSSQNTIIDVRDSVNNETIRFVINSENYLVFVHSISKVQERNSSMTTKETIIEIFINNPTIKFPKEIYDYPI